MKHTIHILALLALAGCASYDGYSLRPGVSTEDEVRRVMGRPAVEFQNADGSRELAYPRGPMGTQTFMADVNRDGILKVVRPVLTDDVFNGIQPGMTREDVLRLIGPPGSSMDFEGLQHESWEYRYMDTWRYVAVFSVDFDRNGIVVSKFKRRIERSDGRK
jgi:outer membrane protein assembly factor BamE (lipoprotein component of BamABCDE complex)